jgi:CBS domain containing-hemolysin-like protein
VITTTVIIAALVFILILTMLSVFEMSLSRVTKVSVQRLLEKNRVGPAHDLKQLIDNRLETLIPVYVGIQICTVSIAVLLTGYLHSQLGSYTQALLAAFGIMFVVVIFRQLISRIFSFSRPEQVLQPLIPIHRFLRPALNLIAYPLSSTLKLFGQLKPAAERTDQHPEEGIQAFINVGKEEGILKKEEEQLVQSAVEFGDKVAREIMTPRTEMVTIAITSSLTDLKKLMTESKYSRIPVYRNQMENIEGFVYLKDLLDIWDRADQGETMASLVRPIHFVPETKRVAELLKELQRKASHMAIVVDEFGGVSGLVTIEDLLEEIAGEIHDEDEAAEMIQFSKDSNGNYAIPGNTSIKQVEELFTIHMDSEANSTIAGHISSALGRVPHKGEKYEYHGVCFEVKEADHRRIHKLIVSRALPAKALSADVRKE